MVGRARRGGPWSWSPSECLKRQPEHDRPWHGSRSVVSWMAEVPNPEPKETPTMLVLVAWIVMAAMLAGVAVTVFNAGW